MLDFCAFKNATKYSWCFICVLLKKLRSKDGIRTLCVLKMLQSTVGVRFSYMIFILFNRFMQSTVIYRYRIVPF